MLAGLTSRWTRHSGRPPLVRQAMGMSERVSHRGGDIGRALRRQVRGAPDGPRQHALQAHALHVLHDDQGSARARLRMKHPRQAGVRQAPCHPRLMRQAAALGPACARGQALDGDKALGPLRGVAPREQALGPRERVQLPDEAIVSALQGEQGGALRGRGGEVIGHPCTPWAVPASGRNGGKATHRVGCVPHAL